MAPDEAQNKQSKDIEIESVDSDQVEMNELEQQIRENQ